VKIFLIEREILKFSIVKRLFERKFSKEFCLVLGRKRECDELVRKVLN